MHLRRLQPWRPIGQRRSKDEHADDDRQNKCDGTDHRFSDASSCRQSATHERSGYRERVVDGFGADEM